MIAWVLQHALVIVFAWSAVSKFGNRRAFVAAVAQFLGHRARPARRAAFAVGVAELGAAALLAGDGRLFWAGAALAAGLLLLFSALLSVALVRGQVFSCHCFGHSDDISRWDVARNLLLLAALAAAARGVDSDVSPSGGIAAMQWLLLSAAVAVVVVRVRDLAFGLGVAVPKRVRRPGET